MHNVRVNCYVGGYLESSCTAYGRFSLECRLEVTYFVWVDGTAIGDIFVTYKFVGEINGLHRIGFATGCT